MTSAASNGGADCAAADGAAEPQPCSACVGSWGTFGPCVDSTRTRSFTVSTASTGGGAECDVADGATEVQACASPIEGQLIVDATLESLGSPGSAAREALELLLRQSLAEEFTAAGVAVEAADVTIVSIVEGSVVVSYLVDPPAGTSAQAASDAAEYVSTRAARGQVTFGGYSTATIDDGQTPGGVAGMHTVQLSEVAELRWSLNPAGDSITFDLIVDATGWVAFGVPASPGVMIGAATLVGQPATGSLAWYELTSKAPGGATLALTEVDPTSAVAQSAGRTVMHSVYPISDAGSGKLSAIWAYGCANEFPDFHCDRGAISLDLVSGSADSAVVNEKKQNLAYLHGACMLLGWGLLLPAGILMSVLRSRPGFIENGTAGHWFKLHQAFQWSGLAVTSIGVIVAALMVEGAHFSVPHAAIGFAVTIFATLQPINALFRGHPAAAGEAKTFRRACWERVHKIGGRCALLAAWANLVLGADAMPSFAGWGDGPNSWPYGCVVCFISTCFSGNFSSRLKPL